MSYYAFFKRWLLLSQHPDCFSNSTSFSTKHAFRDLSCQSGLFPSRLWTFSPTVCLQRIPYRHSEFGWVWYSGESPSPISISTSGRIHATQYLNIFRREPAITEFDWPFTPSHRSSPDFSTSVCSVLHWVLPQLQPAHS